ncbi:hypothetical protein L484_026988 [Morus notabilis]|uniref:Uncharacterized protein n=1 Tax=Morus notabilis TaxID=981085 RepID=W9R1D1_9ROSA|nr:hypothetical protein L484_026988 [Morus notabilis]
MAAMVEMWMTELGKLGEKVGAAKKRPLVILSKAKQGEVKVEMGDKEEEEAKEITRKERVVKKDSSLSEETVFLLMDRFAPL